MKAARLSACLLGFAVVSASAATEDGSAPGTTIVGDQEAAVGLYLAPWQEEAPAEMSRPPGLIQETPAPMDPELFERATAYREAAVGYRRERLQRSR